RDAGPRSNVARFRHRWTYRAGFGYSDKQRYDPKDIALTKAPPSEGLLAFLFPIVAVLSAAEEHVAVGDLRHRVATSNTFSKSRLRYSLAPSSPSPAQFSMRRGLLSSRL